MKWTIAQKINATFPEFNKTADYINYVGSIIHLLNRIFGNHPVKVLRGKEDATKIAEMGNKLSNLLSLSLIY